VWFGQGRRRVGDLLPEGRAARLQVGDHVLHRRVSIIGRLGHHLLEHLIEFRRHVLAEIAEGRNGLFVTGQYPLGDRAATVDRVSREEVEKRATEAIDVASLVGAPAVQGLFRRHVIDCAHHLTASSQTRHPRSLGVNTVLDPCQPHVEDFHRAFRIQQQVRGLDVSMDDAPGVGVLKPLGCLNDVIESLFELKRPALSQTTWAI